MRTSRALAIVGCLLVGHAAAGGLFWALVNVPESNIAMLALSVLVAVLLLIVLSWAETGALLAWDQGVTLGCAARRGLTSVMPFLAGALVFWFFWWLTARADAWHTAYAGEIDAWWMAKTESARTGWIHSGIAILLWLIRYVIGVSLAVAALSAGALRGGRALVSFAWVRRGLSLRQLGPLGLAIVVLILLPLRAVYWRPESIPPNALEMTLVIARLAAIYVVANAGWALVLRAGARAVSATSSPTPPS
jgi:hypothetical protein